MKYNYFRRGLGVLICGSPIWLAVVSGVMSIGHSKQIGSGGIILFSLAGMITLLNMHLLCIRPWLYHRKHKSMEGYHSESAIPMWGTFFVLLGIIGGFQSLLSAVIGLVISIIDVGGLPWVLIFTWKDQSFWDDKDMRVF